MVAPTLEQIDATLARLSAAVAAQAAILMELESAPGRALIDPERLTGATRERATTALAALADAWHCYRTLTELLTAARAVRGDKVRVDARVTAELDTLLHGPTAVPVLPGAPAGSPPPAVGIRPTELADRTDAALGSVRATIDEILAAWSRLLAILSATEGQLATADELAARLRLGDDAGRTVARRLLAELSDLTAADPLAVPDSLVTRLEAAVSTAQAGLDELARRHDTLPQALRVAAALLERIAALIDRAATDADRARSRILLPATQLPRMPAGVLDDERHGLRTWLDRLTAAAAAGRWKEASRGLDRWRELADATLISARRFADRSAAPLQTRDDLRGLLGGWHAKAAGLGVVEDPDLAQAYRHARSVLYTAPTDLDRATALVRAFGAAVDRRAAAGDGEPVPEAEAEVEGDPVGARPDRGRETDRT